MRYGIFSDVHSNLEALKAVIKAYKKEKIDTYLCIGDIVGYASNPNQCIEETKAIASIVVAGNHDWAAVDLFSPDYFNEVAREAIFWTKRKLSDLSRYFLESLKLVYENDELTLVHGTLHNPQDFNYMTDSFTAKQTFILQQTDVCFIGHTHIPGIFVKDKDGNLYYREDNLCEIKPGNKYIVNAGSVGQPRDGNPKAAYCIYDSDKKQVQIKRIDYDSETARKKIIAAGLPEFLAKRLMAGK